MKIALKINLFCIAVQSTIVFCNDIPLKPYEQWWEKHLPTMMPTFAWWLGDVSSPSRVSTRSYIKKMDYKSILDIPCGLCIDFFGYQQDEINIKYIGMDITQLLVDRAVQMGVQAQQGSIERIPLDDSSIDICYSRHILEHLAYYELALKELIRVAKYEVLVVFFIKPTDSQDVTNLSMFFDSLCYGNHYNKQKLEQFILANDKVKNLEWQSLNSDNEIILHIYLNN